MNKSRLIQIAKWLWIALVLLGAGYYLYTHYEELASYARQIQPGFLLLSVLFLIFGKLILVFPTIASVNTQGWQVGYRLAFAIVSLTQLGKYLPGGIWHFVGRISVYKTHGLTNRQTGKAIGLETVWLLAGAMFFGLISLAVTPDMRVLLTNLGIHISSAASYAIIPLLFALWLAVLFVSDHILTSKHANIGQQLAHKVRLILLQAAIWSLFGISFAFMFPNLSWNLVMVSISGFAISWVAGYVAVFAPGGIGVREIVLVAVLSLSFPVEQVAAFSAINRLVWIFVEIVLGAASGLLTGLHRDSNASLAG